MKKILLVVLVVVMIASMMAGCAKKVDLLATVGMVTDAGTINDKSFNQGTWEGIVKAGEEFGYEPKYLKPVGTTKADYLTEIGNLADSGYKLIVCPGFKFETAIYEAQDKYPEVLFVLIDGTPHNDDYSDFKLGYNVAAVFFAEEQSGFLAGVAAAVELKTAEFGFIGGMEIPAVQKFNWGFQQGLAYANANYGTSATIKAENVIYQGTFDDLAAGGAIAAQMYDKGVDCIFTAAGGVGVGAITEAKARAVNGENIWIVGVDVDQYPDGVYSGEKSIILTSAMKGIGTVAYDMVKAFHENKFTGGITFIFDASNDGIGIPSENPNLSSDTEAIAADVFDMLKAGTIVVSTVQGDLIK
ncbi:MAG: BMP family ABC transporter substrate-binding protein [Clostridia bacterium]